MALFQKKPLAGTSQPIYTISLSKTVLIIGLGNPGREYDGTRHNIGSSAVDNFASSYDFPDWVAKKDLQCRLAIHTLGDSRVILCKPLTFMNNSGEAAQALQHFYKIPNKNTLVVYDELAIPFGQLRTRVGGSDAGHNGVRSLVSHIDADFGRLRVGIGSGSAGKTNAADFVLKKFSKAEQANLPRIIAESNAILTEFIFTGRLAVETRNVL